MKLPRFLMVGALCAGLTNILVIGLTLFGVHYALASVLAFGPVLVVGYRLHTAFTFETTASWTSFGRYTLAMVSNYPIWLAALYAFCDRLGLSATLAVPLATILVVVWNFTSARWALSSVSAARVQAPPSSSRG